MLSFGFILVAVLIKRLPCNPLCREIVKVPYVNRFVFNLVEDHVDNLCAATDSHLTLCNSQVNAVKSLC